MAKCPDNLLFSKSHEWLQLNEKTATIGISAFACEQLGDVVFVELPELGTEVKAGDEIATVESVKTAADIYAPTAGTVCEVNTQLMETPELLNSAPYTEAWLFKIAVTNAEDTSSLMPAAEYHAEFASAE